MRNRTKRIFAVLMLAGMALSAIPGCTAAPASPSSAVSSGEQAEGDKAPQGETTRLRVWGYGDAKTEDCDQIAQAVSEIAKEKIGVEIDLVRSNDGEKLKLALTSGENLDLFCTHTGGDLASMANTGQIIPIDDLLKEHGKKILDVVPPENLACGMIDGKLYSIPSENDNARSAGLAMRKDILDELNIKPETIKNYDDVHKVLTQVKEKYPDIYPLVPSWSSGGMQHQFAYDDLGGGFGILEDYSTDSTKVVNHYETKAYKDFISMMYSWKQEGLIMPDATTTTENNLLGTVGFAAFENVKPGKEIEIKKTTNKDFVLAPMIPAGKFTSIVGDSSFAIAAASKAPEKAMELWELMFTDSQVANLFINGLEGKHYKKIDENTIDLPDDAPETGTGYTSLDWAWPNSMISPVWNGAPADLWDQLKKFNSESLPSPALGFRFDNINVMNEITACSNVEKKYDTALRWGELDPAEALPKFIDELKAAGVDAIVAEKQKQLDAWLAAK